MAALKDAASATRTHTGFEHHAAGKRLGQTPGKPPSMLDLAGLGLLQNSLGTEVGCYFSERATQRPRCSAAFR